MHDEVGLTGEAQCDAWPSVLLVRVPQMYYDDLPIWGFIGKVEKILHPGDRTEYKYYLFTHIHFDILYNGKRVIEARSSCSLSPGVGFS